jgi:transposase
MWIAPEDKDPVVPHHPTRKSVGYFGAIWLRDGKLFTKLESGSFNAQSFWQFLQSLYKVSQVEGKKIIIICDNAKYHHAILHKDWRHEKNNHFALDFLPPYSPQLNPVERVWKLLRRLRLHNQYFNSLDNVIEEVEAQFFIWNKPNEVLRKLCSSFG